MTDRARAGANAEAAHPPLLGFAFYVLGTGCALIGLAQILWFAILHRVPAPSLLVGWGTPIGELMGFLGLVIAWRVTRTRARRLFAIGATLWIAVFVLGLQRDEMRRSLATSGIVRVVLATETAPWIGWATVLGLVAYVVHVARRRSGGSTWATTLGVALIVTHAAEQAWHALVPSDRASALFVRNFEIGGLGLVLVAGGLFAAGRTLLRGARAAGAKPRVATRDLPLLGDASVTLAGVTFALCAAVTLAQVLTSSPHEAAQVVGLGGSAIAAALLALGARRSSARAARLAMGSLASLAVYLLVLYVAQTGGRTAGALATPLFAIPELLGAAALYTAAAALAKQGGAPEALRAYLRVAAACVAGAALVLAVGTNVRGEGALVLFVTATAIAAFGLDRSIRAAILIQ